LLGGVLTQAFGWPAIFFVNVPLAAAGVVAAVVLIPRDGGTRSGQRFDVPGAVAATAGITAVVFALVQGPATGWNAASLLAGGVGVVLLVAFVMIESRSADPLLPLGLLRIRSLRNGVTVIALFAATLGSLLYFETLYFQDVHGYNALQTGLAYLVPTVAIFVGANLGGRVATRFGLHVTLATSLAVAAVGVAWLGLAISTSASYAAIVPALLILGLGQGSAFTTMYAAASTGVAPEHQGIGSGAASTGQQVGNAIGLALLVAIANQSDAFTGLRTAILITAAGVALTALTALTGRRTPALVPTP
jgi:predicted MFS family arabinose efflux permease